MDQRQALSYVDRSSPRPCWTRERNRPIRLSLHASADGSQTTLRSHPGTAVPIGHGLNVFQTTARCTRAARIPARSASYRSRSSGTSMSPVIVRSPSEFRLFDGDRTSIHRKGNNRKSSGSVSPNSRSQRFSAMGFLDAAANGAEPHREGHVLRVRRHGSMRLPSTGRRDRVAASTRRLGVARD